ncbi:hypothetical protein FKM82_009430 [Ascaphus truei]
MDSENLLQCPYDKSHMIRPSRFPYHLVKCRENNPVLAKELVTCPYNARHRIPKSEFQLHMSTCDSRSATVSFSESLYNGETLASEAMSTWQSPPCEENWEDEADSQPVASPFVLNGCENYKPNNSGWQPRPANAINQERVVMKSQKPVALKPTPCLRKPFRLPASVNLTLVNPTHLCGTNLTQDWPRLGSDVVHKQNQSHKTNMKRTTFNPWGTDL